MQIRKTFHWYAAHRNEKIKGNCSSIHGHTYRAFLVFKAERGLGDPNISTLFSEFDQIGNWLKQYWDHVLFIHDKDPLLSVLEKADESIDIGQRRWIMNRPTSVENICYELFRIVIGMGFQLERVELQETESSTVIYTKADYDADIVEFNEVKRECYCTIGPDNVCIVCGRSEWEWKLAKRRMKADEK